MPLFPSDVDLEYGSLFQYKPKGTSDAAVIAENICGRIKAGSTVPLNHVIHSAMAENARLSEFLNPDVSLVPVPKSGIYKPGDIWPGLENARLLLDLGLCAEVNTCVERVTPVPKSAFCKGEDRPNHQVHFDSIRIKPNTQINQNIVLIDDVLTKGNTTFGCYKALKIAFPDAFIKVLALVRTKSFVSDIEYPYFPFFGVMHYNNRTDKISFPSER